MATRTISNAGGSWSINATWVEGIAPTASDDVVATATSGNLVVDSAVACFCLSADFTNYVGTLSGVGTIRLSGNITFSTGMTITVTGNLGIVASGTWTSNGKVWSGGVQPLSPSTVTLADSFICVGAFGHTTTGGALVMNGANFYLRGNYTASSGRIISGTSLFLLNTTTTQTINVSGTFSSNLNIDASGSVIIQGLNYSVGTITYVTAGSFSHTGLLSVIGSSTFNTAGMSWNNVTITTNSTMTLNSLWSIGGTLTISTVSIVFTGTAGFSCNTFSMTTGNQTLENGLTYTITNSMVVAGLASNSGILQSSAGGGVAYVILRNGASQDNSFLDATRIDSSGGQPIVTFRGVITTTTNWKVQATPTQRSTSF